MAKTTQKAKAKPKAKPAAKPVVKPKPAPKTKPAAKPKPKTVAAARRLAAARHAERREERVPAPAVQVEPSKGFLYPILRFFWKLFHPGKTDQDFDAWYRNN